MLDDLQVIAGRDAADALGVAARQWQQTNYHAQIKFPEHDGRKITSVVVAGMGGSALAAILAKSWLADELVIPFEILRSYSLPRFVDSETLVICSSYSGNTEETVACLADAQERGAQIAILSAGGELIRQAEAEHIAHIEMPAGLQPRMALIYNLRALIKTLVHFEIIDNHFYDDIAAYSEWLREQSEAWQKEVTTDKNIAKQLALMSVGKTPVIYAGHTMAPVAYKWKISWNENAKNTAFYNELPEFNHNEFIGWASHPVEKPFVIFDLVSNFENERILKRFEISDRLLSGKRPKANIVSLQGETILAQMLWGCILADFVSIYVAILNGVDPTPVHLIEKFKQEMNQ
jgi:glucose/mannose-6-phosphate isomerase